MNSFIKKRYRILIGLFVVFHFFVFINSIPAQFQADFSGSPTSGTAPLTVTFTNNSQGTILTWVWTFQGGTPSAASGPGPHTVVYNSAGSFDVTLIIFGPVTQFPQPTDTLTKYNYITVYQPEPPKDYGDAPDFPDDATKNYPTLKSNNGASHIISDAIYLGNSVDAESDGNPTLDATGDNEEGQDEDGIVIPDIFIGGTADFQVKAHGDGYLNAWIDYNRDGDWEEDDEHIFKKIPLNSGEHTITATISQTAIAGTSYVRFRYGTEDNLMYDGPSIDGEVEDYQIIIIPWLDYGDAAYDTTDTYFPSLQLMFPTWYAQDGPRHQVDPTIFLGDTVDDELNGYPTLYCDGDDDHNEDDEDGVHFPAHLIAGFDNYLRITVHGNGFLNGWFDWNRDGDFDDPDDHFIQSLYLTDGVHMVPFYCWPQYHLAFIAYMRFRFSTIPDLTFTGYAPDGEVEDYRSGLMGFSSPSQWDFGDLPDDGTYNSYPTYTANYGPFQWVGNLFLGDTVDVDPNTQAHADAAGDDLDGCNDDDGVTIPDLIPGQQATIQVKVHGTGYFTGLIDFKRDYGWQRRFSNYDCSDDFIFDRLPLSTGTYDLTFDVPADASPGYSFARFRISSSNTFSSYGPWTYGQSTSFAGEIEDYKVTILNPTDADHHQKKIIPEAFLLRQNYPNPFNPVTTIQFGLLKPCQVRLTLYDMLGNELKVLVNEKKGAGIHQVRLNANQYASGIYFYRIKAGDFVQTKKLIIQK